jgi:hypothetical protein
MAAPANDAWPSGNWLHAFASRSMRDPNLEMLVAAARVLQPLLDRLVFLGGCTTGLLISDPAAAGIRPTKDVDAITEVASYTEYGGLADRLRGLGLKEDASEGAPTCRWRYRRLIIDIMPTDECVLGFTNRWYRLAIASSQVVDVAGLRLRVITPVYFLATKLDAFRRRGDNDVIGSHDLEDVVTVVDGRPEVVQEARAASGDVREYLARQVGDLLGNAAFRNALSGFLMRDSASQARQALLLERLRELSDLRA